jgi:hypothetical protein
LHQGSPGVLSENGVASDEWEEVPAVRRGIQVTVHDDGDVKARYAFDGLRWRDEDGDEAPRLVGRMLHNLVVAVQSSLFLEVE